MSGARSGRSTPTSTWPPPDMRSKSTAAATRTRGWRSLDYQLNRKSARRGTGASRRGPNACKNTGRRRKRTAAGSLKIRISGLSCSHDSRRTLTNTIFKSWPTATAAARSNTSASQTQCSTPPKSSRSGRISAAKSFTQQEAYLPKKKRCSIPPKSSI